MSSRPLGLAGNNLEQCEINREVEPPDDPAELAPSGSQHVLDALHTLRPKDQELLRLAVWEELPHQQIAETLGCSENAVAIRLHRARQRFAKNLSEHSTDEIVKDTPTPRPVSGQGAIRVGKERR